MNSLPFLTRLVAATILAKQNKMLIAEVGYLRTEISYLREQIPEGTVLRFDDRWRKKLARAAAGVGWKRLADIATVAKTATIRSWHRLMIKGKLASWVSLNILANLTWPKSPGMRPWRMLVG